MAKPRHCCVSAFSLLVVVGILASGCDSANTSQEVRTPSNVAAPSLPAPPPTHSGAVSITGWKPDSAVVDQLGPYQDVSRYQVRVPKGWIPSTKMLRGRAKALSWYAARANDEKGPVLRIMVIEAPEPTSPRYEEAKNATLDSMFDMFSHSAPTKGIGFTIKQSGQVNGLPSIRTEITGRREANEPGGGYNVRIATYICKDGPAAIMLTFSDEQSHYPKSATLGVSAILTFRKKL
jgi:hypothetical protein